MNEDAAEIEVVAAADQGECDAAIDCQSGQGSPNHPALDNFYRRAKAFDGFVAQPEGKKNEDDGVGERGERASAMVAVGFFGVGGALRPAHSEV